MENLVVCVPCYNAVEWIRDCLDSIRAQNPSGGQKIVVGDDHSTDGTFELLERLRPEYGFELFQTDRPRRGPYWIVNRIMKDNPARYYQTVDADDMLCDRATERILALMEITGALIAGGQCEYVEEDKTPAPEQRWYACDVSTFSRMVREYAIINSGRIISSQVLELIGFFDDSKICSMDSDYFFRAAQAGIRMRNLPDVTIRVRLHRSGGSLTSDSQTNYKSDYRREISHQLYEKYPFFRNFGIGFVRFFHHEARLQQHNVALMLYFEHYLGCWIAHLLNQQSGPKTARMRGGLQNGVFGLLAARQLCGKIFKPGARVCVIGPSDRRDWFAQVCCDLIDFDNTVFVDVYEGREKVARATQVVLLSEGAGFGLTPALLEGERVDESLCALPWAQSSATLSDAMGVSGLCRLAIKVETSSINNVFDFFYRHFNEDANLFDLVCVFRELVGRYIIKYFQREPDIAWPMIQSGVFGPTCIRLVRKAYGHDINPFEVTSWNDWAELFKVETQGKYASTGMFLRNLVRDRLDGLEGANPPKVAFYGAGEHAGWVFSNLGLELEKCAGVCFLDDNAQGEKSFCGCPVFNTAGFDFAGVDLVVVASDTFEPVMARKLSKLCPREKILTPYMQAVTLWLWLCKANWQNGKGDNA